MNGEMKSYKNVSKFFDIIQTPYTLPFYRSCSTFRCSCRSYSSCSYRCCCWFWRRCITWACINAVSIIIRNTVRPTVNIIWVAMFGAIRQDQIAKVITLSMEFKIKNLSKKFIFENFYRVQYSLPDCYILRFFFEKIRQVTLLKPKIFPDCYTFLTFFRE